MKTDAYQLVPILHRKKTSLHISHFDFFSFLSKVTCRFRVNTIGIVLPTDAYQLVPILHRKKHHYIYLTLTFFNSCQKRLAGLELLLEE